MNKFLEMKERGETIRFSELLKDIPPDGVLRELFALPDSWYRPLVSHRGMEVLKLRLEGLTQSQIAEKMNLTPGQVSGTSASIKNSLYGKVPPYIEVDIPALRKILHLNIALPTKYTCLSELLQAMPSDEELAQLFTEQGNILNGRKSPPTQQDLKLIQMRIQGCSDDSIGEEIGLGAKEVHHHISLTLNRIQRDLKICLDIPELRRS